MITQPTVLILGAGASKPYDFPTGRELLFKVVDKLREAAVSPPSSPLSPWFNEVGGAHGFQEFANLLRLSGQPSVDAFLESRPKYLELGKAAMAACLVPKEEPNELLEHHREMRWYEYLRRQLGTHLEEIEKNKLSIITFNYDRSLEYYLFNAFLASYPISEIEAVKLLETIRIVHVYGQLGKPHWAEENGQGYLPEFKDRDISICVSEMKILSEGSETSLEFEQAREWIMDATRIFILGFGYHKENIRRLGLHEPFNSRPMPPFIWGTTYGLRRAQEKEAKAHFSENGKLVHFDGGGKDKEILEFIQDNLRFT